MHRCFLKQLAFLVILLTLSMGSAYASGKMEVRLNEKVTLKVEDQVRGAHYKWVVQKGKDILNTQTGGLFSYEFTMPGEYQVNLTTTDPLEAVNTTSITLMAGDKFPQAEEAGKKTAEELDFKLTTLPPVIDGRVKLIHSSKVLFRLEGSPDILEYRIDQNIFRDSEGNGTANDDVDNASDESYLRGGYFEAQYDPSESAKVVAEVTGVARDGRKAKKQVEIVFEGAPRREGVPLAIFYTLPAPNAADQMVYLYGEEALVGFYAEESPGALAEYRIDKNIFFDSNNDGDPANDIDNLNHPSFKTGDIWTTPYKKTDGQIIAQLIVVGVDGKGSRIQRSIKFSEESPKSFTDYKGQIRLTADKSFVLQGDPILFTVQGLALSLDHYTFAWDFDGDGVTDKETEGEISVTHIFENPGTHTSQVKVTDRKGNSGDFTIEVPVRETVHTAADFELTAEGNTIAFKNLSTASQNLASKTLQYQWSFGDTDEAGYEDQKDQIAIENPVYTYNKAGTYLVTLTVTDADNVISSKTAEVLIEKDLETGDRKQETEKEKPTKEGKKATFGLVIKILKVILYLVLIVLALILLGLGSALIVFKIQHPDLTFGELIDEMKVKLLTKMGLEDEIEHQKTENRKQETGVLPKPTPIPPAPARPQPASNPAKAAPAPAPKPAPEVPEGKAEEEEAIPPKHPPATGELAKPEGPVPDWLKGL